MAVVTRRRLIGYLLGAGSIAAATGFFVWSLKALDALQAPLRPEQEIFALAKLFVHACISAAFMLFIYSVMRVAERMVLPNWWDASLRKTMLGLKDPATNLVKITSKLAEVVDKLSDKIIPGKK
ncbi:hypothetical protein CYFUS_001682 [Cystobacter fuscus]|uniref:Uncharacterized protein n=1 Tax=Cystobacter fuscus TaxID=43 RepID=A0A250IYF0_9BACT|nr:hypothetical protein [Cystobacter fuscus]ATB36268.1 hypothetical protein CYFUS_001682 [Cystobacter fuscus]